MRGKYGGRMEINLKTIIIIMVAILLIIFFVLWGNKNNSEVSIDTNTTTVVGNIIYNQVTDETTGITNYEIYNQQTGEEIGTVQDEVELQMYIDNPDFVGAENKGQNEFVEYNEDGSVKETTEEFGGEEINMNN